MGDFCGGFVGVSFLQLAPEEKKNKEIGKEKFKSLEWNLKS